jgi:SAM-dependent methyltransferase
MIASQSVELRGVVAEARRMAPYLWAAQLVAGRRVLDVGCGTGEGTELLAEGGAAEVVGLDSREALVEVARGRLRANLRYEHGEVKPIPAADDSFGMVVCFDVLGQLDDDVDRLLAEFARVLRPDGVACVAWQPPLDPEPSLRRWWPRVTRLEQEQLIGSALPAGAEAAWRVHRLAHEASAPRAVVALAGAEPLPEPGPVAVLANAIDRPSPAEPEPREETAEQTTTRAERDELRARLIEAESLGERVVQLEAELEDSERRCTQLQAERDGAIEVIDDVLGSFSWRVTRPLRALKGLFR